MSVSDSFCLRWNDFEANIRTSFKDLREKNELFDLTLCCDNGVDTLRAHKMVLAASSPFFRTILGHNSHQNPFLYLKGVHQKELSLALTFMYNGEVNISQDDVNNFLAVAEELQIKGLTSNESQSTTNSINGDDTRHLKSTPNSIPMLHRSSKKRQVSPVVVPKIEEDVEDAELKRLKMESDVLIDEDGDNVANQFNDDFEDQDMAASGSTSGDNKGFAQLKELESKVLSSSDNSLFRCSECDYVHRRRIQMLSHIESFHVSNSYNCKFCPHVLPTLGALRKHIYRNHRDKKKSSNVDMSNLNVDFVSLSNFDDI